MKTKIIYLFAFLLLVVIGCDEKEDDFQNIKNSTLQVSVSVPEQTPTTRSIESPNNSKDIIVKWKQGNTIDLFFEQGNTLKLVKEVPLTNITNNGKKAQFEIKVPEGIDASKAYTLYGAHGCLTQIKDGKPITDVLMKTAVLTNGKSDFEVPMYFKQTINGNVPNIMFKHIGAMFVFTSTADMPVSSVVMKVPYMRFNSNGLSTEALYYTGNDNVFSLKEEKSINTPGFSNFEINDLLTKVAYKSAPVKTIQWVRPIPFSGKKQIAVHWANSSAPPIYARQMQIGKAYHLKLNRNTEKIRVEAGEGTVPNEISLTFKTNNSQITLGIKAAPSDRKDCWIDLNDNSIKDANETIDFSKPWHEYDIPARQTNHVNIFGNVTEVSVNFDQGLTGIKTDSNPNLEKLVVFTNPITKFDFSQNVNLKHLSLSNNCNDDDASKKIKNLDLSKNINLEHLTIRCTNIEEIDLSYNKKLLSVDVGFNKLKKLDVSANKKLERVSVYKNQLTELNVANGNNKNFKIENAGAKKLNARKNPNLTCIKVDKNFDPTADDLWEKDDTAAWNNTDQSCENFTPPTMTLTSAKNSIKLRIDTNQANQANVWIDLNNNGTKDSGEKVTKFGSHQIYNKTANTITVYGKVTYLSCYKSELTALNVSKNKALESLSLHNNWIQQLDVSKNTELNYLYVSLNKLESLDVSKNKKLKELYCSYNRLKQLDVSKNTQLIKLDCGQNRLTKLNVANDNNENFTGFYSKDNSNLTCIKVDKDFVPDETKWQKDDIADWNNTNTSCEDFVPERMTLTSNKNTIKLEINAEQEDQANIWIDLNGNGTKDNGEKVTTFGTNPTTYTKTANTITVYGKVTYLNCESNELTKLDVSKNTQLSTLYCFRNNLNQLDVSKNTKLAILICFRNSLNQLDVSKNTQLTKLSCGSNGLNQLDVSKNTKLTYLSCGTNDLNQLDISKNTKLTYLHCFHNGLNQLDISKNTKLTYLNCSHNGLNQLDISKNMQLTQLICSTNDLSQLDLSKHTELTQLNCFGTQLTQLDLSKNTKLRILVCSSSSKLTKLNVANGNNNNFEDLYSADNTAFDARDCPQLTCIKVDEGFEPDNQTGDGKKWRKDDTASWHNDGTDCP